MVFQIIWMILITIAVCYESFSSLNNTQTLKHLLNVQDVIITELSKAQTKTASGQLSEAVKGNDNKEVK